MLVVIINYKFMVKMHSDDHSSATFNIFSNLLFYIRSKLKGNGKCFLRRYNANTFIFNMYI